MSRARGNLSQSMSVHDRITQAAREWIAGRDEPMQDPRGPDKIVEHITESLRFDDETDEQIAERLNQTEWAPFLDQPLTAQDIAQIRPPDPADPADQPAVPLGEGMAKVEMYIGWAGSGDREGRWSIRAVEVPMALSDAEKAAEAGRVLEQQLDRDPDAPEAVFTGVYNLNAEGYTADVEDDEIRLDEGPPTT